MGAVEDRVKGQANEIAGRIKRGVGEATDNPELKDEGQCQEDKGNLQQVKGEAKQKVKETIDKI